MRMCELDPNLIVPEFNIYRPKEAKLNHLHLIYHSVNFFIEIYIYNINYTDLPQIDV